MKILEFLTSLFGFLGKKTEKEVEEFKIKNSEEYRKHKGIQTKKQFDDEVERLLGVIRKYGSDKTHPKVEESMHCLRILLGK